MPKRHVIENDLALHGACVLGKQTPWRMPHPPLRRLAYVTKPGRLPSGAPVFVSGHFLLDQHTAQAAVMSIFAPVKATLTPGPMVELIVMLRI